MGTVSVRPFASDYVSTATTTIRESKVMSSQLSTAVAAQEAGGMTCSETPSVTDVTLFQDLVTDVVSVLTFDEAVAASTGRSGWIRRYCI